MLHITKYLELNLYLEKNQKYLKYIIIYFIKFYKINVKINIFIYIYY